MGFRSGSYATVWSVESISNTMTKARISISRKNKQTDQYEQDFGGFVKFVGTAAASKALSLKERDRIKLGDVDVSNYYNKEKGVEYTDFKIFSFEMDDGERHTNAASKPKKEVDDGEPGEGDLPF